MRKRHVAGKAALCRLRAPWGLSTAPELDGCAHRISAFPGGLKKKSRERHVGRVVFHEENLVAGHAGTTRPAIARRISVVKRSPSNSAFSRMVDTYPLSCR